MPLIIAHQISDGVLLSTVMDANNHEDAGCVLDTSKERIIPLLIAINKTGQVLQMELNMK